jgi:hypothetical protein
VAQEHKTIAELEASTSPFVASAPKCARDLGNLQAAAKCLCRTASGW